MGLELRISLPSSPGPQQQLEAKNQLQQRCYQDEGFFLDLIEYILENGTSDPWDGNSSPLGLTSRVEVLENILELGNSAYKVSQNQSGLEMRTTPEVQQQVQDVVNTAGAAGDHLAGAWNAAYSRTPDPVKSYSESIKAVEAALSARISPQNTKQTLGTMIRDVSSKPSKWTFAIADGDHSDGIATVLSMIRLLWEGQRSRHGGPNTQLETVEEAQAAVHLAATLVQFGVSGAFDLA